MYRILNLEDIFWESHRQWKIYFEDMLKQVFTDYSQEKLKAYVGDKAYYELKNLYVLLPKPQNNIQQE